jgi:hypothetical protein
MRWVPVLVLWLGCQSPLAQDELDAGVLEPGALATGRLPTSRLLFAGTLDSAGAVELRVEGITSYVLPMLHAWQEKTPGQWTNDLVARVAANRPGVIVLSGQAGAPYQLILLP